MGTITISFNGSFGWKQPKQFSAMSAGHAAALRAYFEGQP